MDRYDSGDYWYDERNINDLNQKELANFRNKKIGYVFQAFHLIDDMKAIENVELPMGYAHMPRKLRKERAKELLHMVGLDDKINSLPSQLSGGQQQRVAIARALANNPALILADEPTGNLDYNSGKEIMKILKNLNDKGSTIIMVTHDNSIADYAKNKLTMFDGMLV
jgi:putative ABC transport system ATP-binding protein